MGYRLTGHPAAIRTYNWGQEEKVLLGLYERLMG
jgi:hypothetical protein